MWVCCFLMCAVERGLAYISRKCKYLQTIEFANNPVADEILCDLVATAPLLQVWYVPLRALVRLFITSFRVGYQRKWLCQHNRPYHWLLYVFIFQSCWVRVQLICQRVPFAFFFLFFMVMRVCLVMCASPSHSSFFMKYGCMHGI